MPNKLFQIEYRGDVQGVGFRFTAQEVASNFNVVGYVKNLPNGNVEVLVEGEETEIQRFIEALEIKMAYFIRGKNQSVGEGLGKFKGFNIRY